MFRRPREQELAAGPVAVEALLDREQQPGRALDLVNDRWYGDPGDQPSGICSRCVRGCFVIEIDEARAVVACCQVGDECALAHLPRAQQRNGATLGQGFQEGRTNMAGQQVRGHAHEHSAGSDRLLIASRTDCEFRPGRIATGQNSLLIIRRSRVRIRPAIQRRPWKLRGFWALSLLRAA